MKKKYLKLVCCLFMMVGLSGCVNLNLNSNNIDEDFRRYLMDNYNVELAEKIYCWSL